MKVSYRERGVSEDVFLVAAGWIPGLACLLALEHALDPYGNFEVKRVRGSASEIRSIWRRCWGRMVEVNRKGLCLTLRGGSVRWDIEGEQG